MNTLHLVFTRGDALQDCLRAAAAEDTVLLLQDAVYDAIAGAPGSAGLLRAAAADGVALCALAPDAEARAVATLLHPGIRLVDDDGFVALTEDFPRCVSWF